MEPFDGTTFDEECTYYPYQTESNIMQIFDPKVNLNKPVLIIDEKVLNLLREKLYDTFSEKMNEN